MKLTFPEVACEGLFDLHNFRILYFVIPYDMVKPKSNIKDELSREFMKFSINNHNQISL